MIENLFPNFLAEDEQYRQSEEYWKNLWEKIDLMDRVFYQWTVPWLGTGSPLLKDGNPIFDAFSRVQRRAIRVVQLEPVGKTIDIQAYLDSYGGDFDDPESIIELVVACTLSIEAAAIALDIMRPWVAGGNVEFDYDKSGLLVPKTRPPSVKRYIHDLFLPAA
jgi:hypothetical protein